MKHSILLKFQTLSFYKVVGNAIQIQLAEEMANTWHTSLAVLCP